MHWFLENRPDLARQIACMMPRRAGRHVQRLLAIPSRERLERVLRYLLDESEFLSPHGIRSVSRVHHEHPYEFARGRRGATGSTTRPAESAPAACSAATRTGAGRSGSRSTTC